MTTPHRRTPHAAFNFDGEYGNDYAELARRIIPAYEQLFPLAYTLLSQRMGTAGTVLVAGCGTGVEMVSLGQLAPGWRFMGVDPSEQMLRLADQAIGVAGLSTRCELQRGFVSDLHSKPAFDGATLFNVMHFLDDDGAKQALLTSIAERLRPGGALVMVDLHGAPGTPEFERTMDAWVRFMTVRGLVGDAQHTFRQRLAEGIRWVPRERVETLLGDAGFTSVTHFFRALLYGGWVAEV